ncbi:MAG: FecR domain-containing protein [Bacteroidales bacterium]
MKNKRKYYRKDWIDLASSLSEGKEDKNGLLSRFTAEESHNNTVKYWKELNEMNNEKEIDVDKAWNRLYSKLDANGLIGNGEPVRRRLTPRTYLRIAAVVVILAGIGAAVAYLGEKSLLTRNITVVTSENEKNLEVTLPDGSNIYLNRNTKLTYSRNFGSDGREVTLSGEAFFKIVKNPENPFTVNAGNAIVKVLGTTFDVISSNAGEGVEVFVKTGKVMLSDDSGKEKIEVEPGYIGTLEKGRAQKVLNLDPNYMAWNTGQLVYNGQTLDVVFRDLRRVYNMDIVADDPGILTKTWTTPIDNQPQETIIKLICLSFNLTYTRDGNVYHLKEK